MFSPGMLPSMSFDNDVQPLRDVGNKRAGAGQMKDSAIRVMVRIRPPISIEVQHPAAVFPEGTVGISVKSEKHDSSCKYDRVFGETSSQTDVFNELAPMFLDVLAGYNACVFAYGQTSAGKTFTMLGPEGGQDFAGAKAKWGILPRAAELLFGELEKRASKGSMSFKVTASFLQIYNENIYDLLRKPVSDYLDDSEVEGEGSGSLKIREVPRSKTNLSGGQDVCEVYVSGLSEFRVETAQDVIKIIFAGSANRSTRTTDYNATSSRSHAILQLYFEILSIDPVTERQVISKSKLSLVDLAGSEKMQTSQEPSEQHIRELTSINKSLSALGNVIAALCTSQRSHIPYRDSKLTRLLQDSLGGNTKTALIACVAPTVLHAAESVSTLQFADRAKSVMQKVKANTIVDERVQLVNANNEISRLKQLLAHALKREEQGLGSPKGGADSIGLLQENQNLREENEQLKQELAGLHELIDENVVSSSTRRAVAKLNKKGKRQNGTSTIVLKPLPRQDDTVPFRGNKNNNHDDEQSRLMKRSQSAYPLEHEDQEEEGLRFGPGRVRPRHEGRITNTGTSVYKTRKPLLLRPKLHPLANTGLYGEGQQSPSLIDDPQAGTVRPLSRPAASRPIRGAETTAEATAKSLQHDDDNDEDIDRLQNSMKCARSKAGHRATKKTLEVEEQKMKHQLKEEEASLSTIQAMKKSLERQLAVLKLEKEVDEVIDESLLSTISQSSQGQKKSSPRKKSPKASPLKLQTVRSSIESDSYQDDFEVWSPGHRSGVIESISPTKQSPRKGANDSKEREAIVKSIVHSPKSKAKGNFEQHDTAGPRTGTAIGTAAGLEYSKRDIGKVIEMFSFRFSSWEPVEILDFEVSKTLHRCKLNDGTTQWMDLKKKPIRRDGRL